jgi:preprotein translocase subunit SecD
MFQFARLAILAVVGLTSTAVGWTEKPDDKKPTVEFRLAEQTPADGLTEAKVLGTENKVYLHKTAALTAADIVSAEVKVDQKTLDPIIDIRLTEAGTKKIGKLTEDNIGKLLAVVVDGKVISAPVIRAKVGEHAVITGKFTKAEAEKLAAVIGGK